MIDPNNEELTPEQLQAAEMNAEAHSDEVETLKAENEQLRAQFLIERADMENQRKRLERDTQNAMRFANKQLLGELLPVFDSLEAALQAAPEGDPLREGVVLTLRELTRIAGNHGLAVIAPNAGEGFDPEKHQAMSMVEASAQAPGSIVQVYQKGYALNDQLIRPAMVAVAKHE